jgi:hypothetical protein
MPFRRRMFPEVLDTLLSDLAGGVAGEEHPFPPPGAGAPFRHSLEGSNVAEVVSVWGSRDGQPRRFRKDRDYRLLEDRRTLEWPEGAELPDPGTLVSINYLQAAAAAELSDFQAGSVVRTLFEALGLEIARLYAQLEAVNQAAFVDTATGAALDRVVALLGIERVGDGRAAGEVELRRVEGGRGAVTIPAGTRILTADGSVEYETTATVTLADGQGVIRVGARDLEPNDPLPAGSLTLLPVPIAGIAGVTNPAPTALATQPETDEQLRERAKSFLHGSERATLGALKAAIARQGISADVDDRESPGRVKVVLHVEDPSPELLERVRKAMEDARPAGVLIDTPAVAAPARVDLDLRLTTAEGLPEQELRAAQGAVRAKIEDYFRRLPAREPGSVNQLVGLALSVPQVRDIRLVGARVGDADVVQPDGLLDLRDTPTVLGGLRIVDPALPTRVSAVVTWPAGAAPADRKLIAAALTAALSELSRSSESGAPGAVLSYAAIVPAVPLPAAASIPPYAVQLAVSTDGGVTRLLRRDGDVYPLAPFERLALTGVEAQEEAADA